VTQVRNLSTLPAMLATGRVLAPQEVAEVDPSDEQTAAQVTAGVLGVVDDTPARAPRRSKSEEE
jgi:hypothetical protein